MAVVVGAYSSVADLYKGDIPLQAQHGDGTQAILAAADDIDAQIGHIYNTPVNPDPIPANRPTRLLLKKINNLIASGRLMLDMAAAGEDDRLNQYGLFMLKEGLDLLAQVANGQIILAGATRVDEGEGPSKLSIHNEDSVSLVEMFYNPYARQAAQATGASLPYAGNN